MKNMMMKTLVCALLLFLGMAAGHAQKGGLTVSKLTYDTSLSLWVLDLGLENSDWVCRDLQCDLAFPKGLTYKNARLNNVRFPLVYNDDTGYDMPSHLLKQNLLKNGNLRVVVFSERALTIEGSTGRLVTLRFTDDGTLDQSKSYAVNLTNVELVHQVAANKIVPFRQQGIINDPTLRCFDALCNAASVYGEVSPEELDWMNQAFRNNDNITSVDLVHCTNPTVGALLLKNDNAVIYTSRPELVDGNRNVVCNGVCQVLKLTDKRPFDPSSAFKANAVEYSTVISAAGYATVVLPFACELPKGLEAYRLTSVDELDLAVKGEPLHAIAAHEPVLLKGAPGTYKFVGMAQMIVCTPTVVENGLLRGTYLPITVEPDNYLLQKQADGVAFYKVAASTTPGMKPFRAYMVAQTSGMQWLSISLQDPTGVETLMNGEAGERDIYDLGGRKLLQEERGVNIIRNKYGAVRKYLVK